MIREIERCRGCGNPELGPLVNLGNQALTGVFPKRRDENVSGGPLELVKCIERDTNCCGLVQLRHSYDFGELYGDRYGYRSGLNQSMVRHLQAKVRRILARRPVDPGDLVIDIGANDGTLLSAYPSNLDLLGIDPTGRKFHKYYPPHVQLVPEFFSADVVRRAVGPKRARIVTSIAMFYDLESPLDFMRQVVDVLADDGVWVFEQSYLPTMLAMTSYDTICHEHLEYYGLRQIAWLCARAGLKVVDVELNDVNGGSFSVTAAKAGAPLPEATNLVASLIAAETEAGLAGVEPYRAFNQRVLANKDKLCGFVAQARRDGKLLLGCGASTKGNVILQLCGFTADDIPCIADVNEDKHGCFTPGTLIPIVPEADARARQPSYFLVLPWHFRTSILAREAEFLRGGGQLVFPLPDLELVGNADP